MNTFSKGKRMARKQDWKITDDFVLDCIHRQFFLVPSSSGKERDMIWFSQGQNR
jgi:hypothetical protein